MHVRSRWLTAAFVAFAALATTPAFAAAQAQPKPELVGTYGKQWFVYKNGTGADRVCYVLGQPSNSTPKANRDPIFFLISSWPGKKKVTEPSVVPGYEYKEESKVQVQVGSDKFEFFTR